MSCSCINSCNCPKPYNAITQAVDDALAQRVGEIDAMIDTATQAATNSASSATASEVSATAAANSEANTLSIYQDVQTLVPEILQASENVEEAAKAVDAALNTSYSVTVRTVFYTVVGGESSFVLDDILGLRSVQAIYRKGLRKDRVKDFTYDASTRTVQLVETLPVSEAGTQLSLILGIVNTDSGETLETSLASSQGASMVGTASGETVQTILDSLTGSFETGAHLRKSSDLIVDTTVTPNRLFRWGGALPKIVDAGTTPATTGGISGTSWILVGDSELGANLAASGGEELIGSGNTTIGQRLKKSVLGAIYELSGYTPDRKTTVNVLSMYEGWAADASGNYRPYGGGHFVFDPTVAKSNHDGAFFISPTVPWSGSLTDRDNWLNKVGETDGSGSGVWVRCTSGSKVNILWYGATRVHADDNTNPINNFINKMLTSNMNGYVPRGKYRSNERILVDLNISPTRNFGELYGDGAYESVLYSSSTDANAIHFYNTKGPTGPDCFQGKISRIGFAASPLSGAAIIFGLEDFSDNFGNWSFDQVHFSSDTRIGTVTDDRIVLKLNWLFDCTFNNVVVTGYPNYGKAVEMDKVQFTTWNGGSISNAKYGLVFGAVSANNHSIVFTSLDIENVHHGIYSRDTHLEKIRFISPFIDIRDPINNVEPSGGYVLNIEQGDNKAVLVDDIRLARTYSNLYTGSFFGPTHNHAKSIVTGYYPDQTNPTVPASDGAYFNNTGQLQRVFVYPATGVTAIFINGENTALTSGMFTLDVGEYIAIRYTASAPPWRWKAIR